MRRCVWLIFVICLASVCILPTVLCSCDSVELAEYYAKKENYICVTGTISYIQYNEDHSGLYLELSEMFPTLDDTCFKIVGKNLQITQSNGIDNKLKIGKQIEFMTAPKYFGDGYVMPIVAISIDGEKLLSFDEGYANLMNWLSK